MGTPGEDMPAERWSWSHEGHRTAQPMEGRMEPVRIILSGSWVALMLTYLLGDVLRIFSGSFTPGEMACRELEGVMDLAIVLIAVLVAVGVVLGVILLFLARRGAASAPPSDPQDGAFAARGMAFGMLLGAILGTIVWISTDQFVMWVVFMGGGMVVGLAIGQALASNRR